jgi:ribosomal protein S18 acetylase RimI-like enzyme
MLNFHRINSVSDPFFTNLFNLYALAFPPTERRSWEGLEYELSYDKRFYANALVQGDVFAGFLNYWLFDKFCYIEHFAISPSLRGKHIGTEAMEIFKSKINLPIVLEVEMPNNPTAIRRIKFYEKLGYTVLSHNYAQPPYEGDGFLVPLLIMSSNNHFATMHFELIKETLYTEVYHYEVEKENEEEEI